MTSIEPETNAATLLTEPPEATAALPFSRGVRGLIGRWWVAFAASSVFVVSGHLLIKAGLNSASVHVSSSTGPMGVLHSVLDPQVVAGLLVYFLGSICWMIAVAQKEISFLYPLSSVNYVLVVVISYVWFAETITLQRASGVCLIVLGMVLMNRRSRRTEA